MYESIIRKRNIRFSAFPVIDLFPLEVLYGRLFSIPWTIHKPKNLQGLAGLLTNERRKFQMYSRLYERASLGKQDEKVLAGAFAHMTDAIIGGRKRFEQEWKKVLNAKMEYKIIWKPVKKAGRSKSRAD